MTLHTSKSYMKAQVLGMACCKEHAFHMGKNLFVSPDAKVVTGIEEVKWDSCSKWVNRIYILIEIRV